MKMVMRLMGVVFLLAVAGCLREPANSPEAAYRGFIEALQKGNTKKAWTSLSAATRHKVEERSKVIAAASRGLVRDEPELLLFQGSRPPQRCPSCFGPAGEVTVLKADDSSALLRVASASGPSEVKLVKDSGKWLIELSDTIDRRDTP